MTYFGPILDPPLGGSGRKTTTLVRDHEYFIPTKFHQNPWSGFGEEVENVKSLRTDDGRRRTDGRRAMTIAHSSLRLRWANKKKYLPTTWFELSAPGSGVRHSIHWTTQPLQSVVLKGYYNRYASYRGLHVAMGTCVPCFIVKVHVTLTLKRMSQCIVNDFYYKYNAITSITWYFHKIRRVLTSHTFHAYSFKHFNIRKRV